MINTNNVRCVLVQTVWTRNFVSVDDPAIEKLDVNLDFRKYHVSTGWNYNGGSSAPGTQIFPLVIVDYNQFKEPELVAGAISSISYSTAAAALFLASQLF